MQRTLSASFGTTSDEDNSTIIAFEGNNQLGPYFVDFFCYEKRLVVEIDGGQHSARREYDEHRTLWLEQKGFRVLRFWNDEVMNRSEVVLEAILEALERNPLP